MSAIVNDDPANPAGKSSKPNVNLINGLATPGSTPAVEEERADAEAARRDEAQKSKAQEVISEIERIIKCSADDYAGLLGVAPDASEDTILAAWRRLGCMTHEKTCSHSDQKAAFKELKKAAKELGVSESDIKEVKTWDGETDLNHDTDDDDSNDDDDGDVDMETEKIPIPTDTVKEIYDKTTDLMQQLKKNPENKEVEAAIEKQNDAIKEYNTKEKNPENQWIIGLSFFKPQYAYILNGQSALSKEPENLAFREEWQKTKGVIDQYIEMNHLPVDWTVPDVDTYLRLVAEDKAGGNKNEPANPVEYPWPTVLRGDDRVIGARRGVLLLECVEEGRYIRRLCRTSVEDSQFYEEKSISIKDDPTKLRRADGVNLAKMLWVTKSTFKVGQKRNPEANCCVRWKNGGIQVLTIAAAIRAWGKANAESWIQTCCERDGIDPPWAWRNAPESAVISSLPQVGSIQASSIQAGSGNIGGGNIGSGKGVASITTTHSLQQRVDLLEDQLAKVVNILQVDVDDRLSNMEALLVKMAKGVKIEEDTQANTPKRLNKIEDILNRMVRGQKR